MLGIMYLTISLQIIYEIYKLLKQRFKFVLTCFLVAVVLDILNEKMERFQRKIQQVINSTQRYFEDELLGRPITDMQLSKEKGERIALDT